MLTPAELVSLLAAVANGDETAFEKLYAATSAKLYGVVLRILRRPELADEVMQETYLKIWNGAAQFDASRASPITWMVAIARNRAIDLVRKKADVSVEDMPDARVGCGRARSTGGARAQRGCQAPAGLSRPSRPGATPTGLARLL